MLNPVTLGYLAAAHYKSAVQTIRGRSGRNIKKENISHQLNVAGNSGKPILNTFPYPKGQKV